MDETKFRWKYNINSTRLKSYNYADDGYYFITICAGNRMNYFGEIEEGKMILNEIGEMVNEYYLEIPNHFENVILDYFCIMPNHVHWIIKINNILCRDAINRVSTMNNNKKWWIAWNKNPMLTQNCLWKIIRWYKGICSFEIHKINSDFSWQSRFYDRIIRDEDELNRIRNYILENPLNWGKDEFYN